MSRKSSDVIVHAIAGVIRGWRRLSRQTRVIIMCAAGIAVIAAVAIPLVLTLSPDPDPVVAEATPVATPPPVVSSMPSPTPVPTTPAESAKDITLQYGDRSPEVTTLQNRLMDLGYLDLDEPTDYYGPATREALKLFQRQHDLEQDGIASYDTQKVLFADTAEYYAIKFGTTGEDVADVQRQLIDLGYLAAGNATGYYGDKTVEAVKKFQKANKLEVDGYTGPRTLELLYSPSAIATPERRKQISAIRNVDEMIEAAEAKVGKPYVSGAEGPSSFDCSGLVYWCLKQAGSNRGRYNAAGYASVSEWKKVSWSELKRGDLMFFWSDSKGKIGHVAIYLGGGKCIDASSNHGKVVKRTCTGSWFRTNFRWGRRPWSGS